MSRWMQPAFAKEVAVFRTTFLINVIKIIPVSVECHRNMLFIVSHWKLGTNCGLTIPCLSSQCLTWSAAGCSSAAVPTAPLRPPTPPIRRYYGRRRSANSSDDSDMAEEDRDGESTAAGTAGESAAAAETVTAGSSPASVGAGGGSR